MKFINVGECLELLTRISYYLSHTSSDHQVQFLVLDELGAINQKRMIASGIKLWLHAAYNVCDHTMFQWSGFSAIRLLDQYPKGHARIKSKYFRGSLEKWFNQQLCIACPYYNFIHLINFDIIFLKIGNVLASFTYAEAPTPGWTIFKQLFLH